ncbi:MAG: M23 family metallopeptidase [Leptospiraceae bacterium]|nr:M23 family metallopeptidase [Leptospiraceae bacterium]
MRTRITSQPVAAGRSCIRPLGWLLLLFAAFHSLPAADKDILSGLSPGLPEVRQLRQEIAANLKSTARGNGLAVPLRIWRYTVGAERNFFVIMARLSQDADTLVSLNQLQNPNALVKGQTLYVPNARGLFRPLIESTVQLGQKSNALGVVRRTDGIHFHFLPGIRMPLAEMRYFRGEGFQRPLQSGAGRISSSFGYRQDPLQHQRTFHGGLDLAAPTGTAVYATRAGTVVRAEANRHGYGNLIVLKHEYGYTSWYGHLQSWQVRIGQKVQAGQLIGRVGSTGKSTGPHLHFEIRKAGVRQNPAGLVHQ